MGILRARFTEEEKAKFEEMMLPMLEKGDSNTEIASVIGINSTTVKTYIDRMVTKGIITWEYIEAKRQERAIKEQNEKKYKVLIGLRQAKTEQELKRDIRVRGENLKLIIQELIDDRRNN